MQIHYTNSAKLNPVFVAQGIKSTLVPRKNIPLPRCEQVRFDAIKTILKHSTFEELIRIGEKVLEKSENGIVGYNILSQFYNIEKTDIGFWVLDTLDRNLKHGPVSKEEFGTFMTEGQKRIMRDFWAPLISHDLNNSISPIYSAIQYISSKISDEDKTLRETADNLFKTTQKAVDLIKDLGENKLSVGQLLENFERQIQNIRYNFPCLFSLIDVQPKIHSSVKASLNRLINFTFLYRLYNPENILIFGGHQYLSNSTEAYEKALDLLLNKRECHSEILLTTTNYWLKRRHLDGGKVFDKNWAHFINELKKNSKGNELFDLLIKKIDFFEEKERISFKEFLSENF